MATDASRRPRWRPPWRRLLSTRNVVSGTAACVLLYQRNASTILCLLGAILNGVSSKVLKRLFNESRPAGARLEDPGMPSSHAQSLFFFASYLSILAANHDSLSALAPPPSPLVRFATAAAVLVGASAAAVSRIASGLHTPAQIIVGAAFGAAFGASWYALQPRLEAAVTWQVPSLRGSSRE